MYEYDAVITHVYDGDTLTATIDLGFKIHIDGAKLRLAYVNTPEIRGGTEETKQAGRRSRNYVKQRILGKKVRLRALGRGKYGRYLVEVWLPNGNDQPGPESLNSELVRLGYAGAYE
jgi:micrococcal nuclease